MELTPPGQGVHYTAFAGDVPEYYYTCQIEESMAEYFGIDGVTAQELADFLDAEYGEKMVVPEDKPLLGIQVLGMGWSWACVLVQLLLETVTESAPRILRAFRISDVLRTPLLEEEGTVGHWGFIDDYAGVVAGGSQEATDADASEVAAQVRQAFVSNGWEVHKETLGHDLTSLGIDFSLIVRRIRGTNALF